MTISYVKDTIQAIDLGLSVKWADRNLGANLPTDKGELYAWAELSPKETYTWANYSDCLDYSSYGPFKESHFCKKIKILTPLEDAVTYKYGIPWRIPTAQEFEELITKCKWVNANGGYRIYGLNGNSIFLPVYCTPCGLFAYWSATRMRTSPQHAKVLTIDKKIRISYRSRFYGYYLRGVYGY